jgi:hypothetical protein
MRPLATGELKMKVLSHIQQVQGLGLIAISGGAVACLCLLAQTLTPKPILFNNLREFLRLAEKNQLFLAPPAGIQNNTFAADHPLSAEELRELAKLGRGDCGLTPQPSHYQRVPPIADPNL